MIESCCITRQRQTFGIIIALMCDYLEIPLPGIRDWHLPFGKPENIPAMVRKIFGIIKRKTNYNEKKEG